MVKAIDRIVPKQIERAQAAAPDYKAGVMAPARDPIAAARAANAKRIANLQKSLTNKTWENTMAKLTMADWQGPASTKGADRFGPGVAAAEAKIRAFWSKWHPILSGVQTAVRAMPETTDSQREARMLANLRGLKAKKGTWR